MARMDGARRRQRRQAWLRPSPRPAAHAALRAGGHHARRRGRRRRDRRARGGSALTARSRPSSPCSPGLIAAPFLTRRVRSWGYCEREDDLLVRHGLLVARLSVVPYGRMQFIDVEAGPAERRVRARDRCTCTPRPRPRDARIPGLEAAEAARLRDRLADARRGPGGRAVSEWPPVAAGERIEPGVWHRLHPLSPFVRAGRARDRARRRARAGARERPRLLRLARRRRRSSASSCCSGSSRGSSRAGRSRASELRIETGLIRRSSQRYPLAAGAGDRRDRARASAGIFGLAELRLRMGGDTGDNARLAYVPGQRGAEPAVAAARAREGRRGRGDRGRRRPTSSC